MWAGWPEFGQYRNLQQDLDRSWNWVLGFWRCPQTRKLQNLCWHVCHQKHHTCSLCSHNVSDHVYVHATHNFPRSPTSRRRGICIKNALGEMNICMKWDIGTSSMSVRAMFLPGGLSTVQPWGGIRSDFRGLHWLDGAGNKFSSDWRSELLNNKLIEHFQSMKTPLLEVPQYEFTQLWSSQCVTLGCNGNLFRLETRRTGGGTILSFAVKFFFVAGEAGKVGAF